MSTARRERSSYVVCRVAASMLPSTSKEYRLGHVTTPHGYVVAHTEARNAKFGSPGFTLLRFIHGGREHWLRIHGPLTDRGIATVAARFVRTVVEGGAQ